MSKLVLTGSQTVGPFFSPAMLREGANRPVLVQDGTAGERIRIEGRVVDGDGIGVPDALLELWQADSEGRYNHPNDPRVAEVDTVFLGYGRAGTSEDGKYWFETIKPGRVTFEGERLQAPHIGVTVFARGLLNHLVTRLYFEDETSNEKDAILQYVPEERRKTLLAKREKRGETVVYHFDVYLQGAGETVFLNL